MKKKNMSMDYSIYELNSEEVIYAIKMYLHDEHNIPSMDNSEVIFSDIDNTAVVKIVWADKEKEA